MKSRIIIFLLIPFLITLRVYSDDISEKAMKSYEKAVSFAKEQSEKRIAERLALLEQLEQVRKELHGVKQSNQLSEKKIKSLASHKSSMAAAVQEKRVAVRNVSEKIRQAKLEIEINRKESYIGAYYQREPLQTQSIASFFEQLEKEELKALDVYRGQCEYVDGLGEKVKGEMVVIGNIGAYELNGSGGGALLLSSDTLVVTDAIRLSAKESEALRKANVPSGIPFDVTGGAAFQLKAQEPTLWERIQHGGVVVYPILGVGVIALGIILWKSLYLLQVSGGFLMLEKKISEYPVGTEDLKGMVNKNNKCTNLLLRVGLDGAHHPKEVLENLLEEKIYAQIPHLEKMMPTLNVLGAISPLLGLLGTVTGMIATFDVIALHGAGDPGLLSKGISEALITTQLGLVVAVPIILFHSLLTSTIEKNINEMELLANQFVQKVDEKRGS